MKPAKCIKSPECQSRSVCQGAQRRKRKQTDRSIFSSPIASEILYLFFGARAEGLQSCWLDGSWQCFYWQASLSG